MKTLLVSILLGVWTVTGSFGAETESKAIPEEDFHEPVWPIILGAGLMTWGVYALGNSPEESQQYVRVYWGAAVVASISIITYQFYKGKNHDATLSLGLNNGNPSVLLAYDF